MEYYYQTTPTGEKIITTSSDETMTNNIVTRVINNIPQAGIIENNIDTTKEIIGQDQEFLYKRINNNEIRIIQYLGEKTEIIIPSKYDGYKVTAIGNTTVKDGKLLNIFNDHNNTKITSVIIENGVKTIDNNAFYNCQGLINVEIPDSIEKYGDEIFNNCQNITGDIKLPSNLKYIGKGAFYNCKNLTGNLIIPEGIIVHLLMDI